MRKSVGKAFDVPLELVVMYLDNKQYPDDEECAKLLTGNSYVRCKVKEFEIPGSSNTNT